jgi:hypothetical protein
MKTDTMYTNIPDEQGTLRDLGGLKQLMITPKRTAAHISKVSAGARFQVHHVLCQLLQVLQFCPISVILRPL